MRHLVLVDLKGRISMPTGYGVNGTGSAVGKLLARLPRLVDPILVTLTVVALAAGGIAWLAGLTGLPMGVESLAVSRNSGAIGPDQVDDLLACLYGLYALLRLHFVQEEENYFTLAEDEPHTAQAGRLSG